MCEGPQFFMTQTFASSSIYHIFIELHLTRTKATSMHVANHRPAATQNQTTYFLVHSHLLYAYM